jgi:DNA-binding XRE family transcriptional regulator
MGSLDRSRYVTKFCYLVPVQVSENGPTALSPLAPRVKGLGNKITVMRQTLRKLENGKRSRVSQRPGAGLTLTRNVCCLLYSVVCPQAPGRGIQTHVFLPCDYLALGLFHIIEYPEELKELVRKRHEDELRQRWSLEDEQGPMEEDDYV